MRKYTSDTEYARNNLDNEKYIKQLDSIKSRLKELSNELTDAEIEYLRKNGYEHIVIDGFDILFPDSFSFQELHTSLQKMPIPENKPREYTLHYLVSPEDIQESRKSTEYQSVVSERQDEVDKTLDVYNDFWVNEVKPETRDENTLIVYMIAGLNREINPETLSKITGFEKSVCKGYKFNEDNIVIKK